MKQRLLKMVTLGIRQFKDPYYQGFAGQISFYMILSLVPTLLLISKLLTFIFRKNLQDAVGFIMDYIDNTSMTTQVEKMIMGTGGGTLDILFVIIAIWAGSRAQFSLMRIANHIFSDGEITGKGFFRDRINAMKATAVTIVTVIFAIVVLMFGSSIFELVFQFVGIEAIGAKLWLKLRWILAIVLYFAMISYIYYTLPSAHQLNFKDVVPGSIFASVGLLLVTLIYSAYVDTFADYSVLYGSLATVVSLMFWFYFLAWVLCLGLLVNKVWMDTRDE